MRNAIIETELVMAQRNEHGNEFVVENEDHFEISSFNIRGAADSQGGFSDPDYRPGTADQCNSVAYLKKASIYLPNGFIVLDDRFLVQESLWQSAIHKRSDVVVGRNTNWRYIISPDPGRADIEVDLEGVLLAYHRFYFQYFHWFIDCLPRIWIAEKLSVDYEWIYCGEIPVGGFQERSLEALGFSRPRINFGADNQIRRFKEVIYPISTLKESIGVRPSFNDGVHNKGGWHPDFLSHLNEKIPESLLGDQSSQPLRLYIKRSEKGHRRILNAGKLEEFLDRNGFIFIDPGSLPFHDQVAMFRQAEFVVGAHGAGLTNILWCRPDTLKGILEITIKGVPDTGYSFVSSGLGFRHCTISATPLVHKFGMAFADLEIDEVMTIRAVKELIS